MYIAGALAFAVVVTAVKMASAVVSRLDDMA